MVYPTVVYQQHSGSYMLLFTKWFRAGLESAFYQQGHTPLACPGMRQSAPIVVDVLNRATVGFQSGPEYAGKQLHITD